MRILVFTMSFLFGQCVFGQFLADFENFDIGIDSALVDSGEEGAFTSGNLQLSNTYNAEFDFFTNWAISSKTDKITAGSSNSTSSFAGTGQDSDTYAVASAFSPVQINFPDSFGAVVVTDLYVSNNTYAALSMQDGDAFAKKFGGETGNDPDFFRLVIKSWLEGELSSDSVEVYLADYRFEDNNQDYILDEWLNVDLSGFGRIDSLQFSLESSDVGAFGMNTPGFFCIDNVQWGIISAINDIVIRPIDLKIYPNPSSDYIQLANNSGSVVIYDTSGKIVKKVSAVIEKIDVADLNNGLYVVKAQNGSVGRFIKK